MSVVLAAVLAFPANVWAAGSGEAAAQVPVWLCIPFAGLLLCIAVMPLVKGEWWEAHQPLMVGFWIAAWCFRLSQYTEQEKQWKQCWNARSMII